MNLLRSTSSGGTAVSNIFISTIAVGFLSVGSVQADVQLPALFTDHTVLQRGMEVPVWGWADNGEEVTVQFAGQTKTTKAKDGKWMVKLAPLKGTSIGSVLTVKGNNTLEVQDVVVGEVWIASGQSNMQWEMARSANSEKDIAEADSKTLRLFYVPRVKKDAPVTDVDAKWTYSAPETVKGFSAVAYYFGRDVEKAQGVPVGLIHTSWGGSPAEVWISDDVLAGNSGYKKDIVENYQHANELYQKEKREAEVKGVEFTKEAPRGLDWKPSELYNGMIAPLIPYAFKGAIWYQGESNAGRAHQYRTLFPDMIKNWRRDWGQGDFPFLFVQLAPWDKNQKRALAEIAAEPVESDWAELREAQSLTLEVLPNTGMAVITDLGDKDDIHPTRKEPVGQRLALAAEFVAYNKKDQLSSGPTYKNVKFKNGKAVVTFNNAGKGLAAGQGAEVIEIATFEPDKPVSPNTPDGPLFSSFGSGIEMVFGDGSQLTGFAIAGADKKFHWADAKIVGRSIVVSSSEVPKPVAVRYGWADYPIVNLYNSAGLPASPFRTDGWPGVTSPK